ASCAPPPPGSPRAGRRRTSCRSSSSRASASSRSISRSGSPSRCCWRGRSHGRWPQWRPRAAPRRRGPPPDPAPGAPARRAGAAEEGVSAMAATLRERERILQTFGRVVEPVVRDRLLAGELRGEGEIRTASVLFCDLSGFTGLAERTAPGDLVRTLNQFFTTMTDWARTCDGFVDSFIGDGLVVVFGLFDDELGGGPAGGATAAVRCALGMRARLDGLNAERATRGQAVLAMKVGVHTGSVVAGTIGAADRHAYTVIGDTVNVAARLEEVCGELACDVVVSARTWALARDGGVELPRAEATSVALRGRGEPVEVVRIGPRPRLGEPVQGHGA